MVITNAELGYDVSKALSEVKRLGIQLTRISRQRRWKYPVRVEWLEKLLRRYDENPGKPIVHLSDLPEGVHIALDEEGLAFLGRLWYKALERGRFREVEHWAHVLYEYSHYDAGTIEHHHVSKLLSYVLSAAGYDVSKPQTVRIIQLRYGSI